MIVLCFGELSRVPLHLKDSLELFVKRKEFLPGSGFLSRRDMIKDEAYARFYVFFK